jgi:hypothetical protein
VTTKFCMVATNIYTRRFSVWNLLHAIPLEPRILRWLLDLLKVCAPRPYAIIKQDKIFGMNRKMLKAVTGVASGR